MAKVNLHNEKKDYLEETAYLLLQLSLLSNIAYGDPEIIDIIRHYSIGLDKDKSMLEKAIRNCIGELKDFLNEESGNLFGFLNVYLEKMWNIEISDRDNLCVLANLNIAISQIHELLSNGKKIDKNEHEIWYLEKEVLARSNKIMGYWLSKMEDYKPVIEGAIKRKQISSKKVKELLKLCEESGIYCAKDFDKNKLIRQKFMTNAKNRLNVSSERRVLDYLKIIESHKKLLQNRAGKV